MLKKLLKYDLKNINKVLIIFYSLSITFAVITRLLFLIKDSFIMNILAQISSVITISMMFNIVINNIMRLAFWIQEEASLLILFGISSHYKTWWIILNTYITSR